MSGSLRWRLFGLLFVILALVVAWYFILGPLEQARAQAADVRYSTRAFVFVGFAAVFGLFFIVTGGTVAYRNAEKQTPTAAGLVMFLVAMAVSGAGFWWAERQFEALGYTYSGAPPVPKATPFVFPTPPAVERPTFAPRER